METKIGNLIAAFENRKIPAIMHQVNSQCVMASGIAKTVKERLPEAFVAYVEFCRTHPAPIDRLGRACHGLTEYGPVFNIFGQLNYGRDGRRYTNYEAVVRGLEECCQKLKEMDIRQIGVPWGFGCGLGGGKWQIVSCLLEAVGDENGIDFVIYKL